MFVLVRSRFACCCYERMISLGTSLSKVLVRLQFYRECLLFRLAFIFLHWDTIEWGRRLPFGDMLWETCGSLRSITLTLTLLHSRENLVFGVKVGYKHYPFAFCRSPCSLWTHFLKLEDCFILTFAAHCHISLNRNPHSVESCFVYHVISTVDSISVQKRELGSRKERKCTMKVLFLVESLVVCLRCEESPAIKLCLAPLPFDSTLGYPGEGPRDPPSEMIDWHIASINVGSLERHSEIYEKEFDAICLQETRHTDSNTKNLTLKAHSYGMSLHLGPSMKYLSNGSPMWGGVAIASTSGSSRPFVESDDASQIWPSLISTARVTASWVAVAEQITVLVVSVYAFPCAQSDHGKVAGNNNIFQMIFQMVSQFGRIPVIIGGDFQDIPHAYSTIADACRLGHWFDTSMTLDQNGQWDRPVTFSRQKNWNNPQDGPSSSIDGLLVNEVAHQFLCSSQVQPSCGLQHAFVIAKFQWPSHHQSRRKKGCKWTPHAAFNLSKVCNSAQRETVAQNLWDSKFRFLSETATDAEQMMQIANEFAIQTLLESGATWKHGTKERGSFPKPSPARLEIIPSNNCDSSQRELNAISKTLCRIDDLSFKIARDNLDGLSSQIAKTIWKRITLAAVKHGVDQLPLWPEQHDLSRLWHIFVEIRDKKAFQIRRLRIKDWRNRMASSAMKDCKDVYSFLKRKHELPGHNTITNAEGLPIYHPSDALEFARSQWNPIFQYHENHVPTRPLLDVVGNILDVAYRHTSWEPATPLKLFNAIQSRKTTASGGIDGWRTDEMKLLTQINFVPWAILWNRIEEGVWTVPKTLQIARLVMLPKPGAKTQQPIDFRLIALLSIPYLLWSKVRFHDLTPWMLNVFPTEIHGGIKGKKTSDVAHNIAIRCERAIVTKKDVIGIKIDRSKCFDRIDVPIIASLAARLGMPKQFLNVWTQMYQGFRRFLCFSGFIDTTELASNNGVAQGDAASVIAVNVLMSVWIMLLRNFPHIESFAFIDDGYIMCDREHVNELVAAFRATLLYDQLTGQVLNVQKSAMWATSAAARSELKLHLPDIPIFEFFEVLGGQVASSAKNRTRDSANDFHLIRRILADISSLPITFKQKAFLITSKVNSKLAYMPELRPWTKKAMDSFVQNAISALWGARPGWRSTELLFATLTDAIKVHPQMVHAAQTICNLVTRCNNDAFFFRLWLEVCRANNVTSRGLLNSFIKAAGVVGIEFQPPCEIKVLGIKGQFMDFSPKILRKVLSIAATQTLYNQAIRSSTRHDLSNAGSGILDSQLAPPWVTPEPWRRMTGFDDAISAGPMCGACPTADRLYRSALLPTPHCRWCDAEKEDVRHLTSTCPGVFSKLGSPGRVFHDQPNLYSHGHFEVPQYIVDCWVNATGPSSCPKEIFNFFPVTLFGDGSVYNGDHFWSKSLGMAVVDMQGRTVAAQGWIDPMGCSFKAELCAFRAAIQLTNGPLHFVTDCKSLYTVWSTLSLGDLPCNLAYRDIWNEVFIQSCDTDGQCRVSVSWIRAHQADRSFHVVCPFQRNNKLADFAAKRSAKEAAPVNQAVIRSWRAHVRNHRVWLCRLSKLIQSMKISAERDNSQQETVVMCESVDGNQTNLDEERSRLRNRFSKWDWNIASREFSWSMTQDSVGPPRKWQHASEWWTTTLRFFQKVRWRQADDHCSAYELAFIFWFENRSTPPTLYKRSTGIFVLLVDWIRHVMRELKKLSISVFPDYVDFKPRAASWSSQYFPYGTFQGGRFYSSPECKVAFAKFVCSLPNGGKTPKDWAVPLP